MITKKGRIRVKLDVSKLWQNYKCVFPNVTLPVFREYIRGKLSEVVSEEINKKK